MTWELRHRSCLDPLQGLGGLEAGSVASCLMDPPYDDRTHSRGGTFGYVKRKDGGPRVKSIDFNALSTEDMCEVARQLARVVRRWSVIFCAVRQINDWWNTLEAYGLRVARVCVWVKPDAMPQFSGDRPGQGFEPIVVAHAPGRSKWNGGGHKGVFTVPRHDGNGGLHPTQKPLPLMEQLVELFTDPGELVVDPFAGSGTTGVACRRLGRSFIGWEINEEYAATARKRIAETNEQRVLVPRATATEQLDLLE